MTCPLIVFCINVQEFQVDYTSVLERLNMSNLMRYFSMLKYSYLQFLILKKLLSKITVKLISERMSVKKYFNDG